MSAARELMDTIGIVATGKVTALAQAFRASVDTNNGDEVLILRPDSDNRDEQPYQRLVGPKFTVGDQLVVIPTTGEPIVLGKLGNEMKITDLSDVSGTPGAFKVIVHDGTKFAIQTPRSVLKGSSVRSGNSTSTTTSTTGVATSLTAAVTPVQGVTYDVLAFASLGVFSDNATRRAEMFVDMGGLATPFSGTYVGTPSTTMDFVWSANYAEVVGDGTTDVTATVMARMSSAGTLTYGGGRLILIAIPRS